MRIVLAAKAEDRAPVYYGWWVLAASAITEMLAVGSTSYAAGLFVIPLEQELSLSRAAANSGLAIALAGGALTAPFVGYLLDRFSARQVIAIGSIILGLGFAIISATASLPVMILALLIAVPLGGMAIGPLTTSTLTSRWFYRRQGRALGIAAVATSAGGIVVVPLLSWTIENYGWRTALLSEAILVLVIVLVLASVLIRNSPAELGLETHPEHANRPTADMTLASPDVRGKEASNYAKILSNRNFWTIGLILATISGIDQALVVTLVPYGRELGSSPTAAAFLISVFSVAAAIVKVGSGFLADYFDRRAIMVAATLCMILSLSLLLTFSDYAVLLLASGLAGAALGCALPSSAALVSNCFGAPLFGRVMGMIYGGVVIFSMIAVRFIGATFDSTRSYDAAFLVFVVVALAAALAALLIRAPSKTRPRATPIQAAVPENIVGNGSPR